MDNKPDKNQIKKIQKEIDKINKTLRKLELRPCRHDADILQKEKEIEDLKRRVRSLEIKRECCKYTWWKEKLIVYHGNMITEKFHRPTCKYFSWKNCTELFHDRTEAIEAGYTPCSMCKP